jgi:hypothetical protein
MTRRSKNTSEDVFRTAELPSHFYRAGDLIRVLGIEKWRLQKFLSGKRYPLSSSGQIGKGPSSWRLFSLEDMYRIGIAYFLTRDGFTPKHISEALQFIEGSDLIDFGPEGRKRPPLIGFVRGPKEAKTVYIPRTRAISAGSDAPYYVLDLERIISEIDRRIEGLAGGQRS